MRPSEPLTTKPAGYLQLESYSSLRRFWSYLDGAERSGRRIGVVRGDSESSCRRRVEGYALVNAGTLLDVEKAEQEIEDTIAGFELLALAAGDPRPLQDLLSERFELRATFVLALTRSRDLILRPELTYRPLEGDDLGVKLVPKRFGRDELRFMLDKACGLV